MITIGIESSLVEAIRSGHKTIEGRLGKPRFLAVKEGDLIQIREDIWRDSQIIGSHSDAVTVKVTQTLFFESFKEMLSAINYEAAIPTAKNLSEAVATYAQFYTTQDEQEYGVVAIFFELIPS